MRDFGTALLIAATSTSTAVLGLIRYQSEGDPSGLWLSAGLLWASGAAAGYGLARWARRRASNRGENWR